MITGRAEHTATLLPDGKVLVAGGVPDNTGDVEDVALASAELYDPTTGLWSATGSMASPRRQHSATLLRNGKVLVAGGYCPSTTPRCSSAVPHGAGDPDGAVATAELYDPHTGRWTATGRMITARADHTATLLADGKVLVAGAEHSDGFLAAAELYDPDTGRWTATGSMRTSRTQQMATLLRNGKVLVAGGIGPVSPTEHGDLASAELYDPSTGKWTVTGPMAAARSNDPLTVLADGMVLKTGGDGPGPVPGSSELYDPGAGVWRPTGSLAMTRDGLTATQLADGRVLVARGFDPNGLVASAELYDPATRTWSDAGNVGVGTFEHTATLLRTGKVLVAGGLLAHGVASSAGLYDPASGT